MAALVSYTKLCVTLSKVEIDQKKNYSHLLDCRPNDAFNFGFENATSPWASGLRHLYLL